MSFACWSVHAPPDFQHVEHRGLGGRETIPCATIMVDTGCYAFGKTHRMV